MTDARVPLTLSVVHGLDQVAPDAWDALVGDDNPFVEHAFLRSMETAGCVGREAGWLPHHLLVWLGTPKNRRLVGAAPAYLKDNSYGEYIFDWGWANASMRARIPYYPKVVCAVPFTPASGPRVLVAPDAPADAVVEALAKGAQALATEADAWSVHWLFTRPGTPSALEPHGYMPRASFQYHWENKGFESFCDYLSSLKSKRRKEVRRERRAAQALGLEIQVEPGHTLSEDDISSFYACYRSTIDQRGAIPYLTPAWFQQLRTTLGHRALLVTARRDGQLIAGSLAFRRGKHLYGRYWGALEEVRSLHFELCYYRLIEYAISEGITLFEAGAQGQHKISRGFLPRRTHSSHWIRHPGLANAVRDFLRREARHVVHDMDHLDERSPYRRAEACDEELSFSLPVSEEVSQ